MNIGEVAKASGVSAKMVRYYEQTGLIPSAARTAAGYRIYSEADVATLGFIRRARDLGFSVPRINELLGLWYDRTRQSAEVKQLAREHIVELEQRIRDLREMADTLNALIDRCAGDDRPECPILAGLAAANQTGQPETKPRPAATLCCRRTGGRLGAGRPES